MKIVYRDGKWVVVRADGDVEVLVASCSSRAQAFARAADALPALVAAAGEQGLLAEVWVADPLTESVQLDDMYQRDFTNCAWSWREIGPSVLPLWYQSKNDGHYGAELAGFFTAVGLREGGTRAEGRYYDNEAGIAVRDIVGVSGLGVSTDPGAVDVEEVCLRTETDEWGDYCAEMKLVFHAYEIIGATALGAPGMERAQLRHQTEDEVNPPQIEVTVSIAASAVAAPAVPPRAWFHLPEPAPGQSGMLDVYGMPVEELLVDQGDGTYAVPLTIAGDGRVFGHIARWGACHTGYEDICVTAPLSATAYRNFHVGQVLTAEGDSVSTGVLTIGCDHAPLRGLAASQARDHYAHTGLGWADVRVVDGAHGPWMSGVLRPDVDEGLLRVLRASALSGDWRGIDGQLDMIAVLAVNAPGFPVLRASAMGVERDLPSVRLRAAVDAGDPVALVASGIVRRRAELGHDCGCGGRAVGHGTITAGAARADRVLEAIGRQVAAIELRTRHLGSSAADSLLASLDAE